MVALLLNAGQKRAAVSKGVPTMRREANLFAPSHIPGLFFSHRTGVARHIVILLRGPANVCWRGMAEHDRRRLDSMRCFRLPRASHLSTMGP